MDLETLRDFVAVAQAGGISAGARVRGEPKQSLSRRLLMLESELGTRLIERSARNQRLTPEGSLLFTRAQSILQDLDETKQALLDQGQTPRGLLRISAPVLMGEKLLGRVLARFASLYPDVDIETTLSDRRVDLVEEGFDAAIRIGHLEDTSLIARTFAHAHSILVASPDFVSRHEQVLELDNDGPSQLTQFPTVFFTASQSNAFWTLRHRITSQEQKLNLQTKLRVNSLQLALDCARHGAGIANVPHFLAKSDLELGTLVQVLPQWLSSPIDLNIIFTTRRLMSARLRAFIDVLVDSFPDRRL